MDSMELDHIVQSIWPALASLPVLLTLVGSATLIYAMKHWRRVRIKVLPSIKDTLPGRVTIQGRVYACNRVLRSPATGRDCVYYHFGPSPRSQVVGHTMEYTHFFVDDGTERCLVLAEDVARHLHSLEMNYAYVRGGEVIGNPRKRTYLPWNFILNLLDGLRYDTYLERTLFVAQVVRVTGEFSDVPDVDALPIEKEDIQGVLRLWKKYHKAFKAAYDTDQNGKIDQDEMKAAVHDAAEYLEAEWSQPDGAKPAHYALHLIRSGRSNPLDIELFRPPASDVRQRLLVALGLLSIAAGVLGFLLGGF